MPPDSGNTWKTWDSPKSVSPHISHAHREGVDKDAQEEQEDEEDDEENDGTPEASPQDELHGLVWGGKPQERGVGAPGGETPSVSRTPLRIVSSRPCSQLEQ